MDPIAEVCLFTLPRRRALVSRSARKPSEDRARQHSSMSPTGAGFDRQSPSIR